MTLRADHIAAAGFVGFGLLVLAFSRDLPFGTLAFPGSGFLPTLVAGLMILFGVALVVRARESPPMADLDWSDAKHAGLVVVVTAAAIALYTELGFRITVALLIFTLLVAVERRNVVRAAAYSLVVMFLTYGLFGYALKTPLPTGPFGF